MQSLSIVATVGKCLGSYNAGLLPLNIDAHYVQLAKLSNHPIKDRHAQYLLKIKVTLTHIAKLSVGMVTSKCNLLGLSHV